MKIEKEDVPRWFSDEFAKLANKADQYGVHFEEFLANGLYQLIGGMSHVGASEDQARESIENVLMAVYRLEELEDED